MAIAGWKLDTQSREVLLMRFPPRYPRIIADHVTLRSGTDNSTPLPTATAGEIVGEADDGSGVQALIVQIGGTTERGDSSHFHISWSLADGRAAKESNDVIKMHGWQSIAPSIPVRLTPTRWES